MIAITGATGHLGQLVIDDLIRHQVNPQEIIAIVRNKTKAAGLQGKGVQIREADYDQPETLNKAFEGVNKLLLISGNEVGKRTPQHNNVIHAALKNKVKLLAYTSILKADTSKMQLAIEHLATEKAIRTSGLPFVFLRNGWYIENYLGNMGSTLEHGIAGSAKQGRVSAAARADYASAAAAVLTHTPKTNSIFELGGKAFTLTELAQEISAVSGKKIIYHDMPMKDYEKLLVQVGLPAGFAHVLADSDVGIERGDLYTDSQDLATLIERPLTPLKQVIQKALK